MPNLEDDIYISSLITKYIVFLRTRKATGFFGICDKESGYDYMGAHKKEAVSRYKPRFLFDFG
ncbi:MAG: hypothetical protein GY710_04415 [Desulfobacteraceae bacterium]|nr:hypothetical protein [Desulfobacteraceae bacterium]